MRSATVLMYAKPPRIGLSKTRLAKGLGGAEARRIAHFTLARSMRAAMAQQGWVTRLYTAPDDALLESLGGIWPAHLPRFGQGHGDLTDRLNKGLRDAPMGPVIFIGADAPDLSPALLRRAVRDLQNSDAVFGPASDGGFWLFGMNKTVCSRSPFANVRWSGPHAMQDVWNNLPKHARIAKLPILIDIDDADDWSAWRKSHANPKASKT